jgi:hypothetical protein
LQSRFHSIYYHLCRNLYPLSDETIRRDKLNLPLLNKSDEYYSERLELPSDPELTVADTP